jgi:hypothetical protein
MYCTKWRRAGFREELAALNKTLDEDRWTLGDWLTRQGYYFDTTAESQAGFIALCEFFESDHIAELLGKRINILRHFRPRGNEDDYVFREISDGATTIKTMFPGKLSGTTEKGLSIVRRDALLDLCDWIWLHPGYVAGLSWCRGIYSAQGKDGKSKIKDERSDENGEHGIHLFQMNAVYLALFDVSRKSRYRGVKYQQYKPSLTGSVGYENPSINESLVAFQKLLKSRSENAFRHYLAEETQNEIPEVRIGVDRAPVGYHDACSKRTPKGRRQRGDLPGVNRNDSDNAGGDSHGDAVYRTAMESVDQSADAYGTTKDYSDIPWNIFLVQPRGSEGQFIAKHEAEIIQADLQGKFFGRIEPLLSKAPHELFAGGYDVLTISDFAREKDDSIKSVVRRLASLDGSRTYEWKLKEAFINSDAFIEAIACRLGKDYEAVKKCRDRIRDARQEPQNEKQKNFSESIEKLLSDYLGIVRAEKPKRITIPKEKKCPWCRRWGIPEEGCCPKCGWDLSIKIIPHAEPSPGTIPPQSFHSILIRERRSIVRIGGRYEIVRNIVGVWIKYQSPLVIDDKRTFWIQPPQHAAGYVPFLPSPPDRKWIHRDEWASGIYLSQTECLSTEYFGSERTADYRPREQFTYTCECGRKQRNLLDLCHVCNTSLIKELKRHRGRRCPNCGAALQVKSDVEEYSGRPIWVEKAFCKLCGEVRPEVPLTRIREREDRSSQPTGIKWPTFGHQSIHDTVYGYGVCRACLKARLRHSHPRRGILNGTAKPECEYCGRPWKGLKEDRRREITREFICPICGKQPQADNENEEARRERTRKICRRFHRGAERRFVFVWQDNIKKPKYEKNREKMSLSAPKVDSLCERENCRVVPYPDDLRLRCGNLFHNNVPFGMKV